MCETDAGVILDECANIETLFLSELPYKKWVEQLSKDLSEKRFRHVINVTRTAIVLSRRYGGDEEKIKKAALLHDCAKKNEKKYFELLLKHKLVHEDEWKPSPVFHAYVGARVAKYFYGINDEDVLSAIECHTTGKEDMTLTEKIIYLADMIEPHRDFDGVDKIRILAWEDLNEAILFSMNHTISYLMQEDVVIDDRIIPSRNSILVEVLNERKRRIYG